MNKIFPCWEKMLHLFAASLSLPSTSRKARKNRTAPRRLALEPEQNGASVVSSVCGNLNRETSDGESIQGKIAWSIVIDITRWIHDSEFLVRFIVFTPCGSQEWERRHESATNPRRCNHDDEIMTINDGELIVQFIVIPTLWTTRVEWRWIHGD